MIKLPEATVLSNELDRKNFKVWDEKKNVFNPMSISDANDTFSEIMEHAEKNAIDRGLLENAKENAKMLVEGQCKSLLPDYEVLFE